ncbi:MAG: potassium-transporting ATPase subunit KdpA, partial [Vicinamibacterales bacterium]
MTLNGWLQIGLFLAAVLAVTMPLGRFMTRVFSRERTWLDPILRPIERLIHRATAVDEQHEMRWTEYAAAMLLFSMVSMLVLYVIQRVQWWLPWNPEGFAAVPQDLAFNTAASFTTNTNWQAYGGESTMSYLTQMAGLAYHNFVSAATGIALAIAFIRGIAQKEKDTIGNFWVDLVRCALWVLLPFCLVGALALVSQGVVQNLRPYDKVAVIDQQAVAPPDPGGKPETTMVKEQVIAQGPVASQEIIKALGTNGGGFFNANSAHPFENPTPLSNFLEVLAILLIPFAQVVMFGRLVLARRHAWVLYAVCFSIFAIGVGVAFPAEQHGSQVLRNSGVNIAHSASQSGGNMTDKEIRFGIANTALWATATTDVSNGSVNGGHDAFTPAGGAVPLVNMFLGEVEPGGVGSGIYGLIFYVLIAVFVAGLMVGRTPEWLGKKIEAREMKFAALGALFVPTMVLVMTAAAIVT